jgi:flagellar protein FlaF
MSAYGNQTQKYERTPTPGSPRKTEGWALIEAAKRMSFAITAGAVSDEQVKQRRKSSIKLNWKLWTIFQAELTTEASKTDNEFSKIDEEIKLNMLTLCKFVDKHTVGTLLEPTDEKMSILIDLNRNIALGLLNMPEEEVEKKAAERAANTTSNTDAILEESNQSQSQKIELNV